MIIKPTDIYIRKLDRWVDFDEWKASVRQDILNSLEHEGLDRDELPEAYYIRERCLTRTD